MLGRTVFRRLVHEANGRLRERRGREDQENQGGKFSVHKVLMSSPIGHDHERRSLGEFQAGSEAERPSCMVAGAVSFSILKENRRQTDTPRWATLARAFSLADTRPMPTPYDFLLKHADAEFDGTSPNRASLMGTLSQLDAKSAADTVTFEGYSAWAVALHVAYAKWTFVNQLLGGAAAELIGPYPFAKGTAGYAQPLTVDSQAWDAARAYLCQIHRKTMEAIRTADSSVLAGELAAWRMPVAQAVAWLCGHDTYHTAQIRNMGLPAFRGQRIY